MSALDELIPTEKHRVMDLLQAAGIDTRNWSEDFKGKNPSANPKYCYNWSFERAGEFVVTCLWHLDLEENDQIVMRDNIRKPLRGKGAAQWKKRAAAFDAHLQMAYREALPVRAIILVGKRRDDAAEEDEIESSKVKARRLDDTPWAVTFYDFDTGEYILTRGAIPVTDVEQDDPEYKAYEGELRRRYVVHRRRESEFRKKKLLAAMYENGGTLICQVPRCGFDFKKRYGKLGEGFAHVHHLTPLKDAPPHGRTITLKELAVVCANCHAMIHHGGQCRELDMLIPADFE